MRSRSRVRLSVEALEHRFCPSDVTGTADVATAPTQVALLNDPPPLVIPSIPAGPIGGVTSGETSPLPVVMPPADNMAAGPIGSLYAPAPLDPLATSTIDMGTLYGPGTSVNAWPTPSDPAPATGTLPATTLDQANQSLQTVLEQQGTAAASDFWLPPGAQTPGLPPLTEPATPAPSTTDPAPTMPAGGSTLDNTIAALVLAQGTAQASDFWLPPEPPATMPYTPDTTAPLTMPAAQDPAANLTAPINQPQTPAPTPIPTLPADPVPADPVIAPITPAPMPGM